MAPASGWPSGPLTRPWRNITVPASRPSSIRASPSLSGAPATYSGPSMVRGVAGEAGLGVLGVEQQVQVMLQAQPGGQQAGLLAAAQAVQVVHRFPEFVGRDLHFFDQLRRVVEDAPHQGLGARIAAFVELAAGLFEEALDVGSLGNLHGHGVCLCLLLSGVGRESQRSSAWIDEGCRQSPSISMSM